MVRWREKPSSGKKKTPTKKRKKGTSIGNGRPNKHPEKEGDRPGGGGGSNRKKEKATAVEIPLSIHLKRGGLRGKKKGEKKSCNTVDEGGSAEERRVERGLKASGHHRISHQKACSEK